MAENIYEKDFNLWVQEQANALKTRQFTRLDYENLIEEIEDISKSEKRSLESYLEHLIEHILKLKYWKSEYEYNQKHWQVEVKNFRNRLKRLLKRSPSLKNHWIEIYPEIYQDAVDTWRIEFEIPDHDPIPLTEILPTDY